MFVIIITVVIVKVAVVVTFVTFVVVTRVDVMLVVIPVNVPVVMVVNTNYAIITAITFDTCRRIEIFNSLINIITTSITIVSF